MMLSARATFPLFIALSSICTYSIPCSGGGESDTVSLVDVSGLAGISVGCTPIHLSFSGTILYKSGGSAKRPLPNAELWAFEQGDNPKQVTTTLNTRGEFSATVTGWDETYVTRSESGRTKRKHYPARVLVKITAAGCEDRWIRVDRSWKEKTLVLKCSQQ